MITKTRRMNELLDWYEDLLTAKQKELMHFYYQQDLSLREIAQELEISHNAVYDTIERATKRLEMIEANVQAVAYYNNMQALIKQLKAKEIKEIEAIVSKMEQL
jgi:uncharacterized protein